jgi:hypothetical protein
MKKYEIRYLFKEDEQHLIETTKRYPRTLDEAFPQDAPHENLYSPQLYDKVIAALMLAALIVIVLDIFFWRL